MTQPNILIVMADQLAPHFTCAYGHPLVQTPAMDSLAERGARFDAAYCNFPLCAPSRFSMLSGQLPSAIGAWDNGSEFAASGPTLTVSPNSSAATPATATTPTPAISMRGSGSWCGCWRRPDASMTRW